MSELRRRALGWLKERLSSRTRRRLKRVYRRLRSPVRGAQRQLRESVGVDRLAADLAGAGIAPGDVLMVHASLSRIGNVEGGAGAVVESLIQAVSPGGTIMMPSYGDADTVLQDLANGTLVDLRSEPSLTGSITEAFRVREDVLRSSHPFSSVCAWGTQATYVTSGHAAGEGPAHRDSPIGRLVELGGKVVGLGVSLGPVSFYHAIEDTWDEFPFRVHLEAVELTYVDAAGERVTRRISLYDPEVRRTRIDQPASEWIRTQFKRHFTRVGILRTFRFGSADGWLMEARPFYDELQRLARKGVTMYLTEGQAAAIGVPPETW